MVSIQNLEIVIPVHVGQLNGKRIAAALPKIEDVATDEIESWISGTWGRGNPENGIYFIAMLKRLVIGWDTSAQGVHDVPVTEMLKFADVLFDALLLEPPEIASNLEIVGHFSAPGVNFNERSLKLLRAISPRDLRNEFENLVGMGLRALYEWDGYDAQLLVEPLRLDPTSGFVTLTLSGNGVGSWKDEQKIKNALRYFTSLDAFVRKAMAD